MWTPRCRRQRCRSTASYLHQRRSVDSESHSPSLLLLTKSLSRRHCCSAVENDRSGRHQSTTVSCQSPPVQALSSWLRSVAANAPCAPQRCRRRPRGSSCSSNSKISANGPKSFPSYSRKKICGFNCERKYRILWCPDHRVISVRFCRSSVLLELQFVGGGDSNRQHVFLSFLV